MIRKFKIWLYRRKVRKLAEQILASQIAYSGKQCQHDRTCAAIDTAKRFYEEWEKRK